MRKKASPVTTYSITSSRSVDNVAFDIVEDTDQTLNESEGASLGKHLYELCSEIAGAVIRRNLSDDDSTVIRSEIRSGLVEHLSCSTAHADSLIDLSLELIHVNAYGKYRRSDLELTRLIAEAGGEFRDGRLN